MMHTLTPFPHHPKISLVIYPPPVGLECNCQACCFMHWMIYVDEVLPMFVYILFVKMKVETFTSILGVKSFGPTFAFLGIVPKLTDYLFCEMIGTDIKSFSFSQAV